MVKIKNAGTESLDIAVISAVVTTLAPDEEKDIPFDPAKDTLIIKPTPTP